MKVSYRNVSASAKNHKFLIFKKFWKSDGGNCYGDDCECWYYGAWNDRNRANEVALELKDAGFDAECISVDLVFPNGEPAENTFVSQGW